MVVLEGGRFLISEVPLKACEFSYERGTFVRLGRFLMSEVPL